MRKPREKKRVELCLYGGAEKRIVEGAISAGVWSITRGVSADTWCVVHRPTGLVLRYMRSAEVALIMLDELGAQLPDYGADLGFAAKIDPNTDEAKLARAIALGTMEACAPLEDRLWPSSEDYWK